MVPPSLPRPDLLIFATGVMGLAGAAELLFEASLSLGDPGRRAVSFR
jgi:hypothetical protein